MDYSKATTTTGGAGFSDVFKATGGCLVEGEEVIGLLPGFGEQKEVKGFFQD